VRSCLGRRRRSRLRRGCGRFATEQAALKVLYLVATQRRKNRQDLTGKVNGWKTILNTLTVHYGDRIAANTINWKSMNDCHDHLHKELTVPV
jgi:putative transposase